MNLKWLNDLFLFSRKERNGILVLLIILLSSILVNLSIPYLIPEKKFDIAKWEREIEQQQRAENTEKKIPLEALKIRIDPNHVTMDVLIQWGIPAKTAAGWIKYLERGGSFRKKEDVMKLYGMSTMLYERIEKHLQVADTDSPVNQNRYLPPPHQKVFRKENMHDSLGKLPVKALKGVEMVELNKADSATLERLPGIGPVLASRVIKYRNLLGGYYDVHQIREVYGMSDELFNRCADHLKVDTLTIKKLDLNFLSLSEMGRHPYIGFRQARRMVRQRDLTGKLDGTEKLVELFSEDSLRRLRPYIQAGKGDD